MPQKAGVRRAVVHEFVRTTLTNRPDDTPRAELRESAGGLLPRVGV